MAPVSSTAAFVAWMHELYLSELVLLSTKPKPRVATVNAVKRARVPATVTLELGLPDHAYDGARDRYRTWTIVACDVVRWECDGALDDDAELVVAAAVDVAAPIALSLTSGATALLACGAIETSNEGERFKRAVPRPWQTQFTMSSPGDMQPLVGTLLDALAIPGARLRSLDDTPVIPDRSWTLASLPHKARRAYQVLDGERAVVAVAPFHADAPRWWITVQRMSATDAEWSRAWQLPKVLGAADAHSRTLRGDAESFVRFDWRKGVLDARDRERRSGP